MKKYFSLSILLAFFALTLFVSGCSSTATDQKKDLPPPQTIDERIISAEAEKARLQKKLDNVDSVNERVEVKAALANVKKEIDELKLGKSAAPVNLKTTDEEDGFKNSKDRTIVYGPVGAVLHFTEWILVKLYIIN